VSRPQLVAPENSTVLVASAVVMFPPALLTVVVINRRPPAVASIVLCIGDQAAVQRQRAGPALRRRVDHTVIDQHEAAVADDPGTLDRVVRVGQGPPLPTMYALPPLVTMLSSSTVPPPVSVTEPPIDEESGLAIPADLFDRTQVVDRAQQGRGGIIWT
jgi:hypothetical protein